MVTPYHGMSVHLHPGLLQPHAATLKGDGPADPVPHADHSFLPSERLVHTQVLSLQHVHHSPGPERLPQRPQPHDHQPQCHWHCPVQKPKEHTLLATATWWPPTGMPCPGMPTITWSSTSTRQCPRSFFCIAPCSRSHSRDHNHTDGSRPRHYV